MPRPLISAPFKPSALPPQQHPPPQVRVSASPTLDAASAPIDGNVAARMGGGELVAAEADGEDGRGAERGCGEQGLAAVGLGRGCMALPLVARPCFSFRLLPKHAGPFSARARYVSAEWFCRGGKGWGYARDEMVWDGEERDWMRYLRMREFMVFGGFRERRLE